MCKLLHFRVCDIFRIEASQPSAFLSFWRVVEAGPLGLGFGRWYGRRCHGAKIRNGQLDKGEGAEPRCCPLAGQSCKLCAAKLWFLFFPFLYFSREETLFYTALHFWKKIKMPRAKADANKPRGRMTAYAFFVQTCREEHKKKHPDENVVFSEFSKKCAERWKVNTNDTKVETRFLKNAHLSSHSDHERQGEEAFPGDGRTGQGSLR